MQLHQVQRKTKRAKSRQVGRGGKRGKTAGRGHKGQKQHGGHGIRPDMRDTIKKLPKLRGRGINTNKSIERPTRIVNLETISNEFKAGELVSPKTLMEKKIVRAVYGKLPKVKVLSVGELDKKVVFEKCIFSKTAKDKAEKAGAEIK